MLFIMKKERLFSNKTTKETLHKESAVKEECKTTNNKRQRVVLHDDEMDCLEGHLVNDLSANDECCNAITFFIASH